MDIFNFPAIVSWESLHPFLVHFPIALLFVAPVFIIMGAITSEYRQQLFFVSFILMLLGIISLFIAMTSGESARQLASKTPEITDAINRHEELAGAAGNIFIGLAIVFFFIIMLPKIAKRKIKPGITLLIIIFYLLLYFFGLIVLANTSHAGGILVHKFGIRAFQ